MLYVSLFYEDGKVVSITWDDGETRNTVAPFVIDQTKEEFYNLVMIFSSGEGTRVIIREL